MVQLVCTYSDYGGMGSSSHFETLRENYVHKLHLLSNLGVQYRVGCPFDAAISQYLAPKSHGNSCRKNSGNSHFYHRTKWSKMDFSLVTNRGLYIRSLICRSDG